MDVAEAIARLEIQDVLWAYARGVDRSDYDLVMSAYHPDATDDHPQIAGPAGEVVRDFLERDRTIADVGQHHITNMKVDMDGDDDARVESYFLAFHRHRRGDSVLLGIAAGRYLDHFQRRDGAWRILTRRVVMDWTRDDVEGRIWEKIDGQPVPGRRRDHGDDSYAFFADAAPAR